MTYQAETIRVLIASPGDLQYEREATKEVIQAWNDINSYEQKRVLLPVMWETHSAPMLGNHPQKIVNKQVVEKCDMAVALFWSRIGSATDTHISGTVEEIEAFLGKSKTVMVYFSNQHLRPDDINIESLSKLREYKDYLHKIGLVGSFDSIQDYKEKLLRDLSTIVLGETVRWFEDIEVSPDSVFFQLDQDENGNTDVTSEALRYLPLSQFERDTLQYINLHAEVHLVELLKRFGKRPVESLRNRGLIGIKSGMVGIIHFQVTKFVSRYCT